LNQPLVTQPLPQHASVEARAMQDAETWRASSPGANLLSPVRWQMPEDVSHQKRLCDVAGEFKYRAPNSVLDAAGNQTAVYLHLTHIQNRIKVGQQRSKCQVSKYMKPRVGDTRKAEYVQFLHL